MVHKLESGGCIKISSCSSEVASSTVKFFLFEFFFTFFFSSFFGVFIFFVDIYLFPVVRWMCMVCAWVLLHSNNKVVSTVVGGCEV